MYAIDMYILLLAKCKATTTPVIVGSSFAAMITTSCADTNSSVWKEHITDRNGVVIYRARHPVEGPRKSRYGYYNRPNASLFYLVRYALCSLLLLT